MKRKKKEEIRRRASHGDKFLRRFHCPEIHFCPAMRLTRLKGELRYELYGSLFRWTSRSQIQLNARKRENVMKAFAKVASLGTEFPRILELLLIKS